jgi:hypothetical protein
VYESAKYFHSHPGSESDPDSGSADEEPQPSSTRKSRPRYLKRVQTFRPRRPRSIGNPAALDPFGVFPVRASHEEEVLVHNCTYKPVLQDQCSLKQHWTFNIPKNHDHLTNRYQILMLLERIIPTRHSHDSKIDPGSLVTLSR